MPVCHRLFVALLPPAAERHKIGALRDACAPVDAIVSDDRLHLTVAITNDYAKFPTSVADRMLASAARLEAAPVPITLDRINASGRSIALRPNRRPQGLSMIHASFWRTLVGIGAAREGWRLNPHVTLGYDRRAAAERAIAPIGWLAHEIVLIHSIVGATRHEVLGRWPLKSNQLGFEF